MPVQSLKLDIIFESYTYMRLMWVEFKEQAVIQPAESSSKGEELLFMTSCFSSSVFFSKAFVFGLKFIIVYSF